MTLLVILKRGLFLSTILIPRKEALMGPCRFYFLKLSEDELGIIRIEDFAFESFLDVVYICPT